MSDLVLVPRDSIQFLLDRIFDHETSEEAGREFYGHVSPAAARLRDLIASAPPQEGMREKIAEQLFMLVRRNMPGITTMWRELGDVGKDHWRSEADAILSSLRGEGAAS